MAVRFLIQHRSADQEWSGVETSSVENSAAL
jgi:hypothetical protein